jgi:hypothetical protein
MNSDKFAFLLASVACAILIAGCPGKVASNNSNCKPLCEVEAYDKIVKFQANESESWKIATSKITPGSAAQTRVRMDAVGKSLVFSHPGQASLGDEEVAISHKDAAGSTHQIHVQASPEAAALLRARAAVSPSH